MTTVPPVPPTPPLQPPDEQHKMLGAGEQAQPKTFGLPPESLQKGPEGAGATQKQNVMEVAKEGEREAKPHFTPEETTQKLQEISDKLADTKARLQGNDAAKMTPQHKEALARLTDKMSPDLQAIGKGTGQETTLPKVAKDGPLAQILGWLGTSQGMMEQAVNSISGQPMSNPAQMLKVQNAVYRARERIELFAQILGSTVSGIKTLMSTQLG